MNLSQQNIAKGQDNGHGHEDEYCDSQSHKQTINVIFMRHGRIDFSFHSWKIYTPIHRFLNFFKYTLGVKEKFQNNKVYAFLRTVTSSLRDALYSKITSNADYNDFSYQKLMTFLLHEADPPLARKHNIRLKSIPKEIDVIYHSPAKRSIQTANFIQERLAKMGHKKPRISNALQSELAEVKFSKDIISKQEFKEYGGIDGCREIILKKWYDGNNIETFQDSIGRATRLCDFLKNKNDKCILLITHGWYIRLLYMYFKNMRNEFLNLVNTDGIDKYGKYFQISLTNSFSPDSSFDKNINFKATSHRNFEIVKKDESNQQPNLRPV